MPPAQALPKLKNPPIAEVVCGIVFSSLPVDPVVLGPYCIAKRGEFPRHQIQPALEDLPVGLPQFVFEAGVPRLRTWLLSRDDSFVIQVQHDRFYLNWRRMGDRSAYPRFNDRDGSGGLLSQTLAEFEEFSAYCEKVVAARPVPARVELAKVDQFAQGRDWRDLADLGAMIPSLASLVSFARSGNPEIAFNVVDPRGTGALAISFRASLANAPRVVKLETRTSVAVEPVADGIRVAFQTANEELNAIFGRLIPADQLVRFQRGDDGAAA